MTKRLLPIVFSLLVVALVLFTFPARAGTTINVTSPLDIRANDGVCTLREAIIAANTDTASGAASGECPAGSGIDTINIPSGIYTLTLGSKNEDNALGGELDIKQNVSIIGAGTSCAVKFNPNCTVINANSLDRIFDITTTVQASISKM